MCWDVASDGRRKLSFGPMVGQLLQNRGAVGTLYLYPSLDLQGLIETSVKRIVRCLLHVCTDILIVV